MIEALVNHIGHFVEVSEALRDRLEKISKVYMIEKGKFLHKPHKICDTTYFIESGLLRVFYKTQEKEITDSFSAEGEWITSVYSFLKNIPDHFYIQSLEPSKLIGIKIKDLEQCFVDFAEMERFGRQLMSIYYLQLSEEIVSLKFHSAKEKYEFFLKNSKNKASRIPLGMLASYIGISQETLSRIRAEKTPF